MQDETARSAVASVVSNTNDSGVGSLRQALVDAVDGDTITFKIPSPPFFEAFDGVTAPALPAGWVAANASGPAPLWVTSTTTPHTPPNDAFVDDPGVVSDKHLDTPGILIGSASMQLRFRNNYNLEGGGANYYDGGVLEVSSPNINGGAFTGITNAAVGGSFVAGGYVGVINSSFGNPLAGRMAWSQNSGGYINTIVNLGPNVAGQTITHALPHGVGYRHLRPRLASTA